LKDPFFICLTQEEGFVDQTFSKWSAGQGSVGKLGIGLAKGSS
jgi:hypothetical protein